MTPWLLFTFYLMFSYGAHKGLMKRVRDGGGMRIDLTRWQLLKFEVKFAWCALSWPIELGMSMYSHKITRYY